MRIHIKDPQVLVRKDGLFAVEKKDVFIDGERIAALGEAPEGFAPDKVIDGTDKLVMPGLINLHTHHYMTLFRNIANDVPFHEWLFDNMMPREDHLTEEDCYWGTQLALIEQFRTGTTCFNDMYIICDAAARAALDAGSRAYLGRGLVGDENDDGGRLQMALEEMERFRGEPLLRFTLDPHAPYTCSPGYLKKIAAEAAKRDLLLHYHLSESEGEVQTIREKYGVMPVVHADSLGLLDQPIILAHCVMAQPDEIPLLAKPMVSVVSDPASNMKLGNGFAPVPRMLKAGVNVCLGTDGPASNNALNLFRDMTMMALVHKGLTKEPTEMSAQQALAMPTVNAAKALGREQELGQVAEGFLADLIILDLNAPELLPHNDILSSLVYSAYGTEVETVIINGNIVMENRELETIDEERVRFEIKKRTGIFG
ncbi:MAG: amidohydrolase [Lachnospiraceae bacterium]|nr:amidohydrolase [Lachnospiraceae bacterium]